MGPDCKLFICVDGSISCAEAKSVAFDVTESTIYHNQTIRCHNVIVLNFKLKHKTSPGWDGLDFSNDRGEMAPLLWMVAGISLRCGDL